MSVLIEAKNLIKLYKTAGESVYALNGASLVLNAGDYISVVGPSGAGKSTLMHILGGLDTPSEGTLISNGEDVYRLNQSRRANWRNKNVGFVFQFFHLIEELNILENIIIPAFNEKRKLSIARALELLEFLGIEKRARFFPSQLSGGEKQKVAIARALINDPAILLCDEPTGNLDIDSQNKVVELLEKLNKEKNIAVITVTHNLQLASRAKRVVNMQAGKVI